MRESESTAGLPPRPALHLGSRHAVRLFADRAGVKRGELFLSYLFLPKGGTKNINYGC
nr:MAG TPA: hypothetical protein [Caudoviricetes sp.]